MRDRAAWCGRLAGGVIGAFAMGTLAAGAAQPAFPGAVGYGKNATGWRGGEVVTVTSLRDSGPGTLRACAENGALPRVCVFAIGGDIVLDSPIAVGSNLYIAGQSAPAQGVQIRLGAASSSPLILDGVHDVLIRFLKLRPGPGARVTPSVSGITVARSHDVYLDHLSVAFATDQNLSLHAGPAPTHDVTIAWSISAWALDKSNHPLGAHSKGALICSQEKKQGECGRISLISNLFAHNRDRNPEVKATALGPVEVVGNVSYNGKSAFVEIYNNTGETRVNLLGNVLLAGQNTRRNQRPPGVRARRLDTGHVLEVFADGNLALTREGCGGPPMAMFLEAQKDVLVDAPVVPEPVATPEPMETLRRVLDGAGARAPEGIGIDALDARLLQEVETCTGRIVDSPQEAGGWPYLAAARGAPDGDGDGMPDGWERTIAGVDPDEHDPWTDADGDGWSNIESFLATRAGDPLPVPVSPR